MSLLEEGIATGNVLPTGRKEKHSIDNVKIGRAHV